MNHRFQIDSFGCKLNSNVRKTLNTTEAQMKKIDKLVSGLGFKSD